VAAATCGPFGAGKVFLTLVGGTGTRSKLHVSYALNFAYIIYTLGRHIKVTCQFPCMKLATHFYPNLTPKCQKRAEQQQTILNKAQRHFQKVGEKEKETRKQKQKTPGGGSRSDPV
jgi:hypothetical protein